MIKVIVLEQRERKNFWERILGKNGREELVRRFLRVNIFNGEVFGDERIKIVEPMRIAKERRYKYYIDTVRRYDIDCGRLILNSKGREMHGTLLIMYGVTANTVYGDEVEILSESEDVVFLPQKRA